MSIYRTRRSCKVQRSPRYDSLLRTVLPLQQLAHVRPAVRARNQVDTPPVNPTYRHNRGCWSTELDALAMFNAVQVTTRCYGLFYHCNNWLTYDPLYEPETRPTPPRLIQHIVITEDVDLPNSTLLQGTTQSTLRLAVTDCSTTATTGSRTTRCTSQKPGRHTPG